MSMTSLTASFSNIKAPNTTSSKSTAWGGMRPWVAKSCSGVAALLRCVVPEKGLVMLSFGMLCISDLKMKIMRVFA